MKDNISRYLFKKYDRFKKERVYWIIYYVYFLILLFENLNFEYILIYLVKYLEVQFILSKFNIDKINNFVIY